MGVEEKRVGTLRLFKWSLAVQRAQAMDWETYSVQEIVSAQLLALIEDQATRKFLTYSGNIEEAEEALLVSNVHHSHDYLSKHTASFGYSCLS